MDEAPTESRLADGAAVARELGTSERHIRRLTFEGKLPYVKVGGKVRFRIADVRAFVDRHRVVKPGNNDMPVSAAGRETEAGEL